MMKWVIERMSELRLSQKPNWVDRAFSGSFVMKKPKSRLKKIRPSNCPSTAALKRLAGTMR